MDNEIFEKVLEEAARISNERHIERIEKKLAKYEEKTKNDSNAI